MKKLLSLNLLIALAIIFASCGTNNNVVNNRLISKRKYNKGFHINKKGNMKSSKVEEEKESVAFEDVKSKPSKSTPSKKTNSKERKNKVRSVSSANETVASTEVEEIEETNTVVPFSRAQSFDGESDGVVEDFEVLDSGSDVQNEERAVEKNNTVSKSVKNNSAVDSGVMTILLVILALIIAPLAVFIYEGATNRFWITLVLWLVGIGVGFWLFGGSIAWLCGLVAAIYAILIVLGVI